MEAMNRQKSMCESMQAKNWNKRTNFRVHSSSSPVFKGGNPNVTRRDGKGGMENKPGKSILIECGWPQ